MRAVTAAQMRAIDAAAVARDGEIALMRRAGIAIAAVARRYRRAGPLIGLAGNGNNGGDAFAALAELDGERIAYHDPAAAGSAARIDARERAVASGVVLRPFPLPAGALENVGLVLDGLYGVNARLPLDAATAAIVGALAPANAPVLALDIATGTEPSTGALDATHVRAVATIALGRPKLGAMLDPGRDAAGDLWCAPIGMRDADADGIDAGTFVLDAAEFAALRPQRGSDSEKRRSGAPLVIAGSEQFTGAAILCALGAARAGAGYVTIATPVAAASAIRAHLIEQVVVTYDERDPAAAIRAILDLTNHNGSIAIGPGLALDEGTGAIVRGVIAATSLPLVIDASAFFHLTKHLDLLAGKTAILTPHEGEFARLSGRGTVAPHDRLARVRAFVAEHGVTTLLKGRTTLIADRDAVHLNPTGTPALATAGTGDVLSGIIATLLSQGLSPVDAGRAGAYWHGLAGQRAARKRPVGVIAGDVADALGRASAVHPEHDLIRLW
jgi:NAD(P)H-hydrate epimerase